MPVASATPSLAPWGRLLCRQPGRKPLQFVYGVRLRADAGSYCTSHAHEGIEIVYHPSGRGRTSFQDGSGVDFTEGGVVVYGAGEAHDQKMSRDGEDYCVQIVGLGPLPRSHFYLPRLDDPATAEDIRWLTRGRARLRPAEQTVHDLRATGVLLSLIDAALTSRRHEAATPAERHVLAAEECVRERLATLRSLGEVAAHVGISHDRLRHLYKAVRGKTLVAHLAETRLEKAKSLLVHSRLPLKQVASLCGFKDEYYFSAVFRKAVRMAPGRYRQDREE